MHSLAKRLELSLNTLAALDDVPMHYEVLNGGMHHGNSSEVNLFAYYVTPPLIQKYNVDLVILMKDDGFGLDSYFCAPMTSEGIPVDGLDTEFVLKPNREKFKSGLMHPLYELLLSKKLLEEPAPNKWIFPPWEALMTDPEVRKPLLELVGKPLGMLRQKVESPKANGTPAQLIFCYFPTNPYYSRYRRNFWKDLCAQQKIPFLDLCDDFTAIGFSYYPYLSGVSGHFTVDGMFFFSTLLTHELLHQHMIPFESSKKSQ